MKFKTPQGGHVHRRLERDGLGHLCANGRIEVPGDVFSKFFNEFSKRFDADVAHAEAIVACLTHPNHAPAKPKEVVSENQPVQQKQSRDVLIWVWRILVALLLLGILLSGRAHAQNKPTPNIFTIGWLGNGITGTKSYAGPFKINLGTNMSGSVSGNTITLSASATAATAWSGITAATNANAGTFAMSGNTLDLTAATLVKLRVAGGLTTSANGDLGYDTTNKNWHIWANAADNFAAVVPVSVGITSGHLATWSLVAGVLTLNDGGAVPAAGVANPGANGIVVCTGTACSTDTVRSIATADSTHVSVSNGDGVAGNPTLDTGSNIPTQASNGAANQVATYTGANKALVPATTLPTAAMPALTGAVTTSAGAVATSPGKIDVLNASQFCSDAGANDTYACNLSPAVTAYVTGTHYRFKANTANTGPATINFNAFGAASIKKATGGITTDPADNDIRAGQWVDLVYDGTNMQMQSTLGNAPAGSGTVNSGTANHLAYYASSTAAVSSDATATDDGTTLTYSGTGGVSAPKYTATGAGAGDLELTQGSAPSFGSNAFDLFAPASITTSFGWKTPAAAATGIVRGDNSSNTVTLSQAELSGDCTTSGSNAITCTKTSGTSFTGAATMTLPVSIANGGTGTGSTLTGLMRGNASAMTAAELSGDATTSGSNAVTVAKVNGVAYGSSPATDTIPVITAALTETYKAVPDCTDATGNHLNYTASTHAFSCGTTDSHVGTVTSVSGTANEIASTGGATPVLSVAPTFDIHGKTSTAPVKAGTIVGAPATCQANVELYIETDATAGQQLFICNGAGTGWNLVGDGGAGGGNTTSTALTTNKLPKANGANSIIDSSVSDDGTTVTLPELTVISPVWNNVATLFTGLKENVTDTASQSNSLLADLQVGSSTRFKVEKSGTTTITGNAQPAQAGFIDILGMNGYLGNPAANYCRFMYDSTLNIARFVNSTGAACGFDSITAGTLNNVVFADQQSGADMCAKIAAAVGKLPSTGGIVDARGLQGSQTCASDAFNTTKPVQFLLGAVQLTVTTQLNYTSPTTVTVASPATPSAASTTTTGGTLSGSVFVKVTYVVATRVNGVQGETAASSELTVAMNAACPGTPTCTATINAPAKIFGAVGYNVYQFNTTGNEKLCNTIGPIGMNTNWTITANCAGVTPPGSTTAYVGASGIYGAGPELTSIVLNGANAGPAGFFTCGACSPAPFNWTFKDLAVKRDNKYGQGHITAFGGDNLTIENVWFSGGGTAIYWDGVKNSRIIRPRLTDLVEGNAYIDIRAATYTCKSILLDSPVVLGGTAAVYAGASGAIGISGCDDVKIVSPEISGVDGSQSTNYAGILLSGVHRFAIVGGTIHDMINGDGIAMTGNSLTGASSRWTEDGAISGTSIANNTASGGIGSNHNNGDCLDIQTVRRLSLSGVSAQACGKSSTAGQRLPGIEIYLSDSISLSGVDSSDGGQGATIVSSTNVNINGGNMSRNSRTGIYAAAGSTVCSVTNGSPNVAYSSGSQKFGPWTAGTTITINSVAMKVSSVTDYQNLVLTANWAGATNTFACLVDTEFRLANAEFDSNGQTVEGATNQEGIYLANSTTASIIGVSLNDTQASQTQTWGLSIQNTASAVGSVTGNGGSSGIVSDAAGAAITNTITGKTQFAPSFVTRASTNLPSGSAPTTPSAGDAWRDANGTWGVDATGVAACNILTDSTQSETANKITDCAPSSVTTAYQVNRPAAASSGALVNVTASNVVTQSFSGDAAHSLSQLAKTAAVTTFTLCAATAGTACGQAGQYRISYNFYGSGTACSSVTAGSVGLNLTWTDTNAVTHTTISMPMWDQKTAAMTNGLFNFNTALGTESASGSYIISTNGTIIQAATTYTACTTGTGTYNLKMTVEQLQ